MPTDPFVATGSDPLTALADAMDAAVEAAERARSRLGELVPGTGRLLARAVYRASYAVSFGIVFPAVFLAVAVPRRNAVVHGLIDGARDAIVAIQAGGTRAAPRSG